MEWALGFLTLVSLTVGITQGPGMGLFLLGLSFAACVGFDLGYHGGHHGHH